MSEFNKGFQLKSLLQPLQIARVVLAMAAVAVLVFAVKSISLPDNAIRVASFEPSGVTGIRTNITIKFSKGMVVEQGLDQPVLDPPIQFEPPLPGIARWIETDVLRYFPDQELLPSTEYTATIKSDKTWASGYHIDDRAVHRFRTPSLWLTQEHFDTERDIDQPGFVRMRGRLVFAYPVNFEDLRKALSIKGDKDASKTNLDFVLRVTGRDETAVNSSGGAAQPLFERDYELYTESFPLSMTPQKYALTIGKGILCQNCSLPLEEPLVVWGEVAPKKPLVVVSVGTMGRGEQPVITVRLSVPVSAEEAKGYVKLDPPEDFTLEGGYSELVLRGNFRLGGTYTVTVAQGLPSREGTFLEREFSATVRIADLEPSVAFTSEAVFLPRSGNSLLEVKTVNITNIDMEVEQVFANNLVYFLTSGGNYYNDYYDSRSSMLGRSLFITSQELAGTHNVPLTTSLNVRRLIGDTARGIFKVSVRSREQRWTADSRYVMLTDIGLTARFGDDYLMVWANSLTQAEPLAGVAITLLSRNNQTLLQGNTDARGIVTFRNIKDKLSGFEPYVITASRTGDLSYLQLDETLLPISDFDVSGRPYLASGYEAFLYTERGVYRPGDTVHLVSLVRGPNGSLPPSFPYFLVVYDTHGKKFTSYRVSTEGSGMVGLDFVVPDYLATGKYSVAAVIGEDLQIGRIEFLVEEFMPDRIKVSLTTPQTVYTAGESIQAAVNAKLLFGPPAVGYRVSGQITVESHSFAPSGWPGYRFTNSERDFNRMDISFRDTVLNDTGGYTYTYQIPGKVVAPSALKGLISATVAEHGGRGVSSYTEVEIHPYQQYIGLKLLKEGYAKPGETVSANVVAVGIDGKGMSLAGCEVRFHRLVYNTVAKRDPSGFYRYVSERKQVLLDSSNIAVTPQGTVVSFKPPDYGSYELVARDPESGHSSSVEFYASGWGYAPWALNNPDRIELAADKKDYRPGEQARIQVRAPFGGKLLVTLEGTEVSEIITRDMQDNTAELTIPIRSDFFPMVYITAAVIRPADSLLPNMPGRAFGVLPLQLATGERSVGISLQAPEVIKPKSNVSVTIQLDQPRVTEVTVAAVDAGILQLTDYSLPNPVDFFYGKKRPYLRPFDLYSFVYPRTLRSKSHLPAGDRMFAASRRRHVNPITARRVKSVALWSGIVRTDATGKATVNFKVPEFNGKLIVMAVAAQGDRYGAAQRDMTVRDKIVVQENFPRFVSPNDVFEGMVTLFNNTGKSAEISVQLAANGPVELISPAQVRVPVESGREGVVTFRIRAKEAPGKASFKITAAAEGETAEVSVELPNRPAMSIQTLSGSGVATKAAPAEFVMPAGWVPTTDQYVIQTAGMPAATFARNLQYLLQYPYGCIEQATSRVMPLLYYNDLIKVADPALFGSRGAEYFIQEGIIQLNSMLLPDYSFAYWPGGTSGNHWSTIYASHFLSEASKAGYQVDKKVLEGTYDHLNDLARGKMVSGLTETHRIYAAYVLAQAGRLEQRGVSYLKKVEITSLPPHSRYQLAGALALTGNTADALRLLPASVQPNVFEPETGGDFNSGVRTDAILLEVLLAVSPGSPSAEVVARSLWERARAGHWYTTQENAWGLMALGKYFRSRPSFAYKGEIAVEGDKTYAVDSSGFKVTRNNVGGKRVTVSVTSGDGSCFYYWQASGIPAGNAAPEYDKGIKVRRQYLTEDATDANLREVKLGDRLIGIITVEATEKALQNVVVADLLPGGFEIENPRLKTTPRLSWVPRQESPIDFQDIRDDRLLLFVNLYPGSPRKFYYSVRAISAGEFKIPPVAAECMYNPLIASSASSGIVTIAR